MEYYSSGKKEYVWMAVNNIMLSKDVRQKNRIE